MNVLLLSSLMTTTMNHRHHSLNTRMHALNRCVVHVTNLNDFQVACKNT